MTTPTAIDVLRDSHGFFTMVAVDQRDSLRTMLREGQHLDRVDDTALVGFKTAVVDAISGAASGILLDQQYGLEAAQRAKCPVILAADILTSSEPGGPIDTAVIDDSVTVETVTRFNAKALKLLLPWHPQRRNQAIDLAHAFMARCRELEVPGVLEGVVRPREGRATSADGFAEALIAAADDLAPS
jgi:sulfofructosephosphate aldolase